MLPFRVINVKYLQESISFELRIGRKCSRFSCLYSSPSQTQDEFETFLKNFELTLDKIDENNPFMTIVLGDFNTKSNNWCKSDITSFEGSKVDTIANSYGLNQLIQEPTHILNSSSSCIDLIFTSQLNLVMESGIHSSFRSNCHHQIVFAKFNLSIFNFHLMKELFGTMKQQILNLSSGSEPSLMSMLMKKFTFSPRRCST